MLYSKAVVRFHGYAKEKLMFVEGKSLPWSPSSQKLKMKVQCNPILFNKNLVIDNYKISLTSYIK